MDAVNIAPPPIRRRPRGLLVQEAADLMLVGEDGPVGDRWRAGVTFLPYGCDGIAEGGIQFCIDDSDNPSFNDDPTYGDCPVFPAFHVYATDSALARDYDSAFLQGRLKQRYEVIVSEGITRHVIGDGDDEDSLSLASSAQVLTGEDGIERAIALASIESGLAAKLHGGQGIVWLSPSGLASMKEYLELVDGHWQTPSGHLVIADAGHDDQPPTDETSLDNEGWVYGTGLIAWALGEPMLQNPTATEYLDRTRNIIHARAVAEAVAAFDPCAVVAAKFRYSDDVVTEGS